MIFRYHNYKEKNLRKIYYHTCALLQNTFELYRFFARNKNEQYRNFCNTFELSTINCRFEEKFDQFRLLSRYKNRGLNRESDRRTRRIDRVKERPTNDGKNVMINKSKVRERRN